MEREDTQIKFQTSLALKSIIAQLINSILLPFLINYFLEGNLYHVDGLAYDIFSLAITNTLLTPILTFLDPPYLFYKLKNWYYNRPANKLGLLQS
jgi:hypothetical protein